MRKISLYIAVFLLLCGFAFSANAQISTSTPLTEDERLVLISQLQAQLASLIQQLVEALNNQMNAAPVASGGFVEEETVYVPESAPAEMENYEILINASPLADEDTGYFAWKFVISATGYFPSDNVSFRVTDDQTGLDLTPTSFEIRDDMCVNHPEKNIACGMYAQYEIPDDKFKTYTITMTVNGETRTRAILWENPERNQDKFPYGFVRGEFWRSSRVIQ